jgi:hypothetical protein
MPDDLFQAELLFYKSIQSHKGLIPSINFNEDEYALYLQYASVVELERDVVCEKTYRMIIAHDNWDGDEEIFDDKIRMRYF